MDDLTPGWIRQSDALAEPMVALYTLASPEESSSMGLTQADPQTTSYEGDWRARIRDAAARAVTALEEARSSARDPHLREDIAIMLRAADILRRGIDLHEAQVLALIDVPRIAFGGMRVLLDQQNGPERKALALVRLRRYAGLEPGTTALALSAEAETRARFDVPGLAGPYDVEIRTALALGPVLLDGIAELLSRSGLRGWEEPFATFRAQCVAYADFLARELAPRARADHRLPPEIYAHALERMGVDVPAGQLRASAHAAFDAIQAEMQALAPRVAADLGFTVRDYRDVIRQLKQQQIRGDAEALVAFYRERLAEIEAVVVRERLLTLPSRPAKIRVASLAESAEVPAAHMNPAPLVGNTGQVGEFVLPLDVPPAAGSAARGSDRSDDFTHDAVSWTLTAHEARPGHEAQFDRMLEVALPLARTVFAFNSVNVEGWALYAEKLMLPYMPPAAQLCSLQMRMHRAARAFLDPELQAGTIRPEDAQAFLERELVFSPTFARSEVERYTFRAPAQATSYFYGYTKFVALRAETERRLGAAFEPRAFHDFILDQGLLPPDALSAAVLERWPQSARG